MKFFWKSNLFIILLCLRFRISQFISFPKTKIFNYFLNFWIFLISEARNCLKNSSSLLIIHFKFFWYRGCRASFKADFHFIVTANSKMSRQVRSELFFVQTLLIILGKNIFLLKKFSHNEQKPKELVAVVRNFK